jgi:quercetin dioxygenase-like cupin family protein
MSIGIETTTTTTTSGAPLPLAVLPQGELLTVNEADNSLLRDALGPGVHFKPLRLDLEAGYWVVLAVLSPGAALPIHYHTGTAEAYTISGRWYYLEYPDQPQTAGSYLYEPGGSVHTFVCPESNTEDTVIFIRVEGANINFTEDGQFHSILDAVMIRHLISITTGSQEVGPVNYISGSNAGLISTEA